MNAGWPVNNRDNNNNQITEQGVLSKFTLFILCEHVYGVAYWYFITQNSVVIQWIRSNWSAGCSWVHVVKLYWSSPFQPPTRVILKSAPEWAIIMSNFCVKHHIEDIFVVLYCMISVTQKVTTFSTEWCPESSDAFVYKVLRQYRYCY